MKDKHIALFLVDDSNEFQQLLRADAEAAGRRFGVDVETRFTGTSLADQLAALQTCLEESHRPSGIMVMCVHDRGLLRAARRAAQAGVHWVLLNPCEDDLEPVRKENPQTALTTFSPDEVATGRIQGRQFRALVPRGARVLYVQGLSRCVAARQRTAGMMESIDGAGLDVTCLEAGWTREAGREAVTSRLRMELRVGRHVDLIGCQNDALAQGALEAVDEIAGELGRPEIRRIPVTGCDGSPNAGQKMVLQGDLRATVVLPLMTGPAVEAVVASVRTGTLPPPVVSLEGTSFPSEASLGALAQVRRSALAN